MKFYYHVKDYIKNEKGIALPLVIMVLVVTSIIGLSLMGMAVSNVKMSSGERDHQSVYYIAEAGATMLLNEISSKATTAYSNTQNSSEFFNLVEGNIPGYDDFNILSTKTYDNNFEESFGNSPIAEVSVIMEGHCGENCHQYKVVSNGTIDNRTRTVESRFTLQWNEKGSSVPIEILSDMAVFSNKSLILESTITGNIGTNSTDPGSIFVDWGMANYKGVIYKVPEAKDDIVKMAYFMNGFKPTWEVGERRVYSLPKFPDYPTGLLNYGTISLSGNQTQKITLYEDRIYDEIKLVSNTTLTIDVGDQNKSIRIKRLLLTQGHIRLIGSGKLTLYIEDEFKMGEYSNGDSSLNKDGNSERLTIFYKGSNSLNFGGNIRIIGSLYAKNANLSLGGSGSITGHIITGGTNITISGGANANSRLILAPNAHVQMDNGTVRGSIISNTFTIQGGAKVIFDEFSEDELVPYYPPDNDTGDSNSSEALLNIEPIREN